MTIEAFKRDKKITDVLMDRGIFLKKSGKGLIGKCPFHEDKSPSFSVNPDQNVWNCHAGCGGGSVIDLLARFENLEPRDVIKKYVSDESRAPAQPATKPVIEKVYSYTDANGEEVYQALRLKPKSFRQRRKQGGAWVYNMDGVERVLYRLHEVARAQEVWVVEGEKDADNLAALGYCATCNVGGAGKWLDGYTEALKGKEVILCGDNDEPGKKHVEFVLKSIETAAKSIKVLKVPPPHKDVSDWIESTGDPKESRIALDDLVKKTEPIRVGADIPIHAIWELEKGYKEYVKSLSQNQFNLGKWLPSLGPHNVRGLVPGELVTILAATGVGKTAILQNIARYAAPLKTLFFEMELPAPLVYERFIGVGNGMTGDQVESIYAENENELLGEDGMRRLNHISVCTEARLTPERLERLIQQSELRIGEKPKVVMVDYVQLLGAPKGGSRYEKMSSIAEEMKILAKATGVILFIASQIARKDGEDQTVTLFDAKDSGSIENSSGLVLGAWRDSKDKGKMFLKILKNTKGTSGLTINCVFKGASMQIGELAKTHDVPA